jgi:hypothetical protein
MQKAQKHKRSQFMNNKFRNLSHPSKASRYFDYTLFQFYLSECLKFLTGSGTADVPKPMGACEEDKRGI